MSSLKAAVQDETQSRGPIAETTSRAALVWPSSVAARLLGLRFARAALLLLLAFATIAIDGYHPYSEDAGIYVSGIKQAIHPGIYGSSSFFILPYLQISLFPDLSAWIVRSMHLPLEDLLFALQILTTWLLLFACWALAKRCFEAPTERWAALLLTAVCLSVPVAGSSLYLMDPYLTGRSFSTPLSLLALVACLDRKFGRTALLLVLIGIFHPLMVVYATSFVLVLVAAQRRTRVGLVALSACAIAAGVAVQFSQRSYTESVAYENAVGSRYYFFLANWHWYEQIGVAAPLVLLGAFALWRQRPGSPASAALATGAVALGATSIVVALLFAREQSHSHLVAALQPLRPFLLIYLCMFLILGGVFGRFVLKQHPWRWFLLFAGAAVGLGIVQHLAYPNSAHLELPGSVSSNGWVRAFVWIRENTPTDAVFALDADYIHAHGEDGQGFRAIAERNSLADRSKDGGAAAVFRQLAELWMDQQSATTDLNQIDDAERLRRLAPYHVDWIVLNAGASTQMQCPFIDDAVKVCHLR